MSLQNVLKGGESSERILNTKPGKQINDEANIDTADRKKSVQILTLHTDNVIVAQRGTLHTFPEPFLSIKPMCDVYRNLLSPHYPLLFALFPLPVTHSHIKTVPK